MTAAGLEIRAGWHRIERVLHDRAHQARYEPTPRPVPPDPLTLARRLEALARDYDDDAREARQAAASCRQYAADLRAGMG